MQNHVQDRVDRVDALACLSNKEYSRLKGCKGPGSSLSSLPTHAVWPAVRPSLRRQVMRRCQFLFVVPLFFLAVPQTASAQDVQLPAGTLLRCTLDEPDFSAKSAKVGDP